MPNGYKLNFVIPAGEPGPANGLNAYGGLYSTNQQSINLNGVAPITVTLDNVMAQSNIDTTANNSSITITNAGNYEITYRAIVNLNSEGEVSMSVQNGGQNLAGTIETLTLPATQDTVLTNTVITALNNNDTLTLVISSGSQLDGNIEAASLVVKKID